MDSYERIALAFHQRIDCIAGAVDALAPGLEAASATVVQTLLNDGKILIVACEGDAALANYLASSLRSSELAGPPLPALPLVCDQLPDNALEALPNKEHELWTALKTLSRDGDVVLCLDSSEQAFLAKACSRIAVERNLISISMSEPDKDCQGLNIALQAESTHLRRELMLMASHCLGDQIQCILLGE